MLNTMRRFYCGRRWHVCVAALGLAFILLSACVKQQDATLKDLPETIRDEQVLSQQPWAYVAPSTSNEPLLSQSEAARQAEYLVEQWFSPWHRKQPQAGEDKVFAFLNAADPEKLFGEDTRTRGKAWLMTMRRRCNVDSYPSEGYPAMVVRNTSMRVLPTSRPAFYDFKQAGEGWPFDMLQNSALWAQTPVYVSHMSYDGDWALVESHFAYGWVPASDIAPVASNVIDSYEWTRLAAFVRDEVPVFDSAGVFRFHGRIGMLVPVIGETERTYDVLLTIKGAQGRGILVAAEISKFDAVLYPQMPTRGTLANVAGQMMGSAYGWGGLYANRDCSATLMDLFVPFGIRLPRNSLRQAEAGSFESFEGMTREEKLHAIRERGVPWMTLLWKPGHIMLYLGDRQGQPAMLHATWGVKVYDDAGREGRFVIGRTVITGLEPGANLPGHAGPQETLLGRMGGMTTLPVKIDAEAERAEDAAQAEGADGKAVPAGGDTHAE